MLRIKEGVNLETLKDYEFLEEEETWRYEQGTEKVSVMILIDKISRRIMVSACGDEGDCVEPTVTERTTDKAMDVLYELIQSGIVEKMEDENE